MSDVPNSKYLEPGFKEFAVIGEVERNYAWDGHPGAVRVLGFMNRGNMGSYASAVQFGAATGTVPSTAAVRTLASRAGVAVNMQQEVAHGVGLFARLSVNDGSKEAYDFTDVNRSLALGAALEGERWHREGDVWGIAGAVNQISSAARSYFAAGGLGLLIGDGRLPHPSTERILETYYSLRVINAVTVTADYQLVVNPAYNTDRGPVSIFGVRVHAQF